MVDSSWDNGGLPPVKKGLGTGMKVLLGCGIAALLAFAACAVGGAILGNMIKKDPKAFEKRMEGFAEGLVRKDWERFRNLVDRLQSDEGAAGIYRSNPGLHQAYATEGQFLQAVRSWRPHLTPLPDKVPVGRRHRRHRRDDAAEEPFPSDAATPEAAREPAVDIQKVFGTTRIQCRYPNGTKLSVTFDGEQIQRLEVE
ncbi:MAG: hypothetical protein HXX12_13275 [Geothrix sp.]|uniref:hypothetical protein n=1 Tax=Geothrix sp. TaxID=1962974 RepID=UPI0017C04196|nr:hypothetical protein [Geothrix sp.]NWJ41927.1 hypothetical protein [Geothrix sp.]WIL20100.1 MAG: hypothetical protein QOZ81_002644 [Geothrix sp.]